MAKAFVSNELDAWQRYITNLKEVVEKLRTGTPITNEELLMLAIPPQIQAQIVIVQKIVKVGKQFVSFYFTDCGEMCPYRWGEVTVMVIPLVITLGEYAAVKVPQLLARLRALRNGTKLLNKTEDVDKLLTEAERAGKDVVSDGNKITIKELPPSETVLTTVEKQGDDVVIDGAENIAKGGAKTFSSQIDDAISRLTSASKYELDNTGRYGDV